MFNDDNVPIVYKDVKLKFENKLKFTRACTASMAHFQLIQSNP